MSTGTYRSEYEAQLAARAAMRRQEEADKPPQPKSAVASRSFLRARAIDTMTAKDDDGIAQAVEALADDTEDVAVRLAALARLKELEFFGAALDPHRAAYTEALKKAAQSKDGELARGALEVLSIRKDPFARAMLLGFLKAPKTAPFALEQVIQLLAYDDHSAVAPDVRAIAERSKDVKLVEESLLLLSSDPGTEELFARLLQDRSQPAQVRMLSASGLHNVNPERFAGMAKKIVDDESEDDDLRAECLSTLTHFSDYAGARRNKAFAARVKKIESASPSVNLKATASRFRERLAQEETKK